MAFKRIEIIDVVATKVDAASAPAGSIKAKDAKPKSVYLFKDARYVFLSIVDEQASFMPVLGGGPLFLPLDTDIMEFTEEAKILPPDAPEPVKTAVVPATEREVPVEAVAVAVAVAEPVEAPKPKKQTKKTKETPVVEAQPVTPAPAPVPATAQTILVFRGSVVGAASATLHAYVEQMQELVFKATGTELVDLRTAEGGSLGFGKWKGLLSAATKENPIPPGIYVVTPGDERVDVVASALLSSGAIGVM